MLFGLVLVHAGYTRADSAAALFVAVLVLLAAARLMQRNVDVLMDRAPADAEGAARVAIAGVDPPVSLQRLRMRQAGAAPVRGRGDHRAARRGGRPGPRGGRRGRGGASAPPSRGATSSFTSSRRRTRPSFAIVHTLRRSGVPSRARGAQRVRARGVGHTEVSLHLKLPGELTLEEAHEVANQVERAIAAAFPRSTPSRPTSSRSPRRRREGRWTTTAPSATSSCASSGTSPAPILARFASCAPTDGLLAYLTLGLDPASPLAEAHARASEIEERIRLARPDIADVIVHTEP